MKLCLIIAIACMGVLCACHSDPLATLPEFSFRLDDSVTIVNSKDIPEGQPIVIINFEVDCAECQYTTDTLLRNFSNLKDVNFYFITTDSPKRIKVFSNYFHLERYHNIVIGQDYKKAAHQFYHVRTTPYIAVYDDRKVLAAIYDGKPIMANFISMLTELKH